MVLFVGMFQHDVQDTTAVSAGEDDNIPTEQAPAVPVRDQQHVTATPRPTSAAKPSTTARTEPRPAHQPSPDAFCHRHVQFDLAAPTTSEQNPADEADPGTVSAGGGAEEFGSSDSVSYEDLMEFALDGPRHRCYSVLATACILVMNTSCHQFKK